MSVMRTSLSAVICIASGKLTCLFCTTQHTHTHTTMAHAARLVGCKARRGKGRPGGSSTRATKVICWMEMMSLRASTSGSKHRLDVDRYSRPLILSALLHSNSVHSTQILDISYLDI